MIPPELVFANDLQRGGHYATSGKIYQKFFDEYPSHPLRFKCLYEVADNLFYEKKYRMAKEAYHKFMTYCEQQDVITEDERSWIDVSCIPDQIITRNAQNIEK